MEKITDGMQFEEWSKTWLLIAEQKGHMLLRDNHGNIDVFVLNSGHHNGPRCIRCEWEACMHCDPFAEEIPDCKT